MTLHEAAMAAKRFHDAALEYLNAPNYAERNKRASVLTGARIELDAALAAPAMTDQDSDRTKPD